MRENVIETMEFCRGDYVNIRRTDTQSFLLSDSDDLPIKKSLIFKSLFENVLDSITDFEPLKESKNGKVIYIDDPVSYIGKLRRFGSLIKVYYSKSKQMFLIISYEYRYRKPKIGDLEGYGWMTVEQFSHYMGINHIFKLFEKYITKINDDWCFENTEKPTHLYRIKMFPPEEVDQRD